MSNRATRYLRDLLCADDPHCTYCGRFLANDELPTMDHIVAKARGGTDDPDNLALACRRCNQFKGSLSIDEFRLLLAWMLERLQTIGGAA